MPASEITLYSVNADLMALLDTLDMCETDAERAMCEAEIERTIDARVHKVDSFAQFLRHLESQAALAEQEIARLETRESAFLRTRDRLVSYAIRVMQSHNLKRLEGDTTTFTLRQNVPAVDIQDTAAIPGQFKTVRQEVTVDKMAIKKAIQSGDTVPGAALKEPTVTLVRR